MSMIENDRFPSSNASSESGLNPWGNSHLADQPEAGSEDISGPVDVVTKGVSGTGGVQYDPTSANGQGGFNKIAGGMPPRYASRPA